MEVLAKKKNWFDQNGFKVRFSWGLAGSSEAAARGDILVIVDVLSFSTSVATAIERGGIVHPVAKNDDGLFVATQYNAHLAVHRSKISINDKFSLSPLTYLDISSGTHIVLPSLNGSTCSMAALKSLAVFTAALLNAKTVATAVVQTMSRNLGSAVTVVACGERWEPPNEDGELRFALEDYLGAGAVLSGLGSDLSPEAKVCAQAFLASKHQLPDLLSSCGSGIELKDKGFLRDVAHALQLNIYTSAPVIDDGMFVKYTS